MAKPRIYPPRNNSQQPLPRDLSEESEDECLNVYSSLEPFSESDNDIKSIIIEQVRKYRNLSIKIKRSSRTNERYAVLAFDNFESLNYFKRAIIEKRDRIIVYDRSLYFNFPQSKFNQNRNQRDSFRREEPPSFDRRTATRKIIPSRTLFVGNIEDNIEPMELRRTFEPFGEILDISVKSPHNQNALAFAFIKYRKLADAVHAREQLQDSELGRKRMKIGFGKPTPRHALWVGGLNENIEEGELITEIRRVADIAAHKFNHAENMAYFIFETISDSRRVYDALKELKLPHSGSKLEVDYADPHTEIKELMDNVRLKDHPRRSLSSSPSRDYMANRRRSRSISPVNEKVHRRRSSSTSSRSRRRSPSNESRRSHEYSRNEPIVNSHSKNLDKHYHDRRNKSVDSSESDNKPRMRIIKQEKFDERGSNYSIQESNITQNYERTLSLRKIVQPYPVVWKGGISVKSHVSVVSLHLVCGSVDAVSSMVHQATLGGDDPKLIVLTKRFPLLPDRIADLRSKLATAIASRDCCILIAQSARESPKSSGNMEKHIASLISYFKSKQAAGIGSIGKISIYAFPPSPFTIEQLSTLMPHAVKALNEPNEDYLMVVISR